jgi:AraC-like DNA-binding protein
VDDLLPPSKLLKPYVEGFWQRRGSFERAKKVRVLADACTKMIFELVPMPWPSCYVIGTQLAPIVVSLSGEVDRIGVRFRLGMASFVIGSSLDGLSGRFTRLEDLGIAEGPGIHARLAAASGFEDRASILNNWLLSRLDAVKPDAAELGNTSRIAQALLRGLPPPRIAEMMNWSERRLQRVCRDRFGASAGNLHRFHRFELLQARLSSSPPLASADLAAELGFSDQSHMAREFRHFGGITISSFIRERAGVGNLQDGGEWLRVLRELEEHDA